MKLLVIAAALLASVTATAQQRCSSGVYASVADDTYLTIHVNGDSILGAMFSKMTTNGAIGVSYSGIGTTRPQQIPVWQHQSGSWDGSGYRSGGLTLQGACYALTHVTCDDAGYITVTATGYNQMPSGTQWGIDCHKAYQVHVGTGKASMRYPRVF